MATDASDRDAQRRELEEIRRKFTEMGARVGSLFDPAADEEHDTDDPTPPPAPAALPAPTPPPMVVAEPARGLSRVAVAAVAVALLAGIGLGWLLHPQADPPAAASPTSATPTSVQPQARTRTVVPPACLEAARKGDQAIHYYTIKVRDRRLVEALKAYTLASQACRREASP
jgi:hypothetical protein